MPVPSTRIHFRVEVRIKNGGQAGCIRALFPSMEKISRLSQLRQQLAATTPLSPALRGGHTQTLLGHILPSLSRQEFTLSKAHTLSLSDGDKLIGHIGPGSSASRGWLHIFHGLSGDADSVYMPRAAVAAAQAGFNTMLWNHRGCGAGRGLAMAPYHSGRSDDIARVIHWAKKQWPGAAHGVLGFSLSANAACLLAAGVVPAIKTTPLSSEEWSQIDGSLPDFAIAVNPPFDLAQASRRLSHESSRLYGSRFVFDLLQLLDDRKSMSPTTDQQRKLQKVAQHARANLNPLSSVEQFDELYTSRAGGFDSRQDYYAKASSGRYLSSTSLPLVVLSADDDPITHGFADLPTDFSPSSAASDWIVFDRQESGGHMGYVDTMTLRGQLRAVVLRPTLHPQTWFERRLAMYLEQL